MQSRAERVELAIRAMVAAREVVYYGLTAGIAVGVTVVAVKAVPVALAAGATAKAYAWLGLAGLGTLSTYNRVSKAVACAYVYREVNASLKNLER